MDMFKVYNCILEIQNQIYIYIYIYFSQSYNGSATNIKVCFVGQIKQRGLIPDRGATGR